MSSVYRVLCLSHDPAIILSEVEYHRPEAAVSDIAAGIDGHAECDLLIGRYSYPLIEVGCPPATGPERSGRPRCSTHSTTEWVDVAWLRILLAVHRNGTKEMQELVGATQLRHWSYERLRRLRDELGIDADEPADQSGEGR
ncbi:hypothetical protein FXF51_05895 [Nonomuraea sp. PA05]|uniref:hypothetical protein n=1 Tax=Nonomuraea sp. PA05 TaxID=2604466 RepID=UPI0011DB2DDF|nr:hypothetical protein [Nonomuraea sp. PA05]TYB69692.1 hypothetical protein FXF51_05895 [Nonomuraea sp. PA05]